MYSKYHIIRSEYQYHNQTNIIAQYKHNDNSNNNINAMQIHAMTQIIHKQEEEG